MAENEHTPPLDAGNTDLQAEAKRVVAESLVIIESIIGGIEALQRQPEAGPIQGQLDMLKDLAKRAIETVEGFGETVGDKKHG